MILWKLVSKNDDIIIYVGEFLDEAQQCQDTTGDVKRKVAVDGEMTLKERFLLLPQFKQSIKGQFESFEAEFEHPHGRVDVRFEHKGKVVFVELKYINENENALPKLRMATGQVLMYGHEPRLKEKIAQLWVVINKSLSKEEMALLAVCSEITSIKYFAVVQKQLIPINCPN